MCIEWVVCPSRLSPLLSAQSLCVPYVDVSNVISIWICVEKSEEDDGCRDLFRMDQYGPVCFYLDLYNFEDFLNHFHSLFNYSLIIYSH